MGHDVTLVLFCLSVGLKKNSLLLTVLGLVFLEIQIYLEQNLKSERYLFSRILNHVHARFKDTIVKPAQV